MQSCRQPASHPRPWPTNQPEAKQTSSHPTRRSDSRPANRPSGCRSGTSCFLPCASLYIPPLPPSLPSLSLSLYPFISLSPSFSLSLSHSHSLSLCVQLSDICRGWHGGHISWRGGKRQPQQANRSDASLSLSLSPSLSLALPLSLSSCFDFLCL